MAVEVLLPKLGLTMETGLIEEWLVPPGTQVQPGVPLLRLATDKVDVEVEAEGAGLFHPAVESGVELPPGALIGWLLDAGEEVPAGPGTAGQGGAGQGTAGPGTAGVGGAGQGKAGPGTAGPGLAGEAAPPLTAPGDIPAAALAGSAAPAAGTGPGATSPPARSGRLFASPNARRVAREHGIDIARLNGTGPGGRIVTADVVDAAVAGAAAVPAAVAPAAAVPAAAGTAAPAPAAGTAAPAAGTAAPAAGTAAPAAAGPPPVVTSPLVRRDATAAGVDLSTVVATGPGGTVRRSDVLAAAAQQPPRGAALPPAPAAAQVIPLTGMRGVIAARMHASLQEMAQLTLGTEAGMDAAVALRAQLKQQWAEAGIPVPTITDLIVRAAALALREHPRLNASVHDNAIHVQPEINVGLAVALEDGLIVPVVKRADELPLSAIAAQTRRLAVGAREGKLGLPDLEGGTFTVSTLGSYGIDFFTPVITVGQVAILGVGRLRDSVRWDGATPVRTQVLTLSVTFDHRAIDGGPAAEFLRSVVARLASPLSLLA